MEYVIAPYPNAILMESPWEPHSGIHMEYHPWAILMESLWEPYGSIMGCIPDPPGPYGITLWIRVESLRCL